MSVAVCRFYFKNAVSQFQNGNIKSAAAKIVNGDNFVFFRVFVKTKR